MNCPICGQDHQSMDEVMACILSDANSKSDDRSSGVGVMIIIPVGEDHDRCKICEDPTCPLSTRCN